MPGAQVMRSPLAWVATTGGGGSAGRGPRFSCATPSPSYSPPLSAALHLPLHTYPPPLQLRYTFPFMFISALFWLLHTWVLDPMPNAFKRKEFLRYRRELLYVTSKLNFRSPAREVRV